jgi:hypothetical protein
MKASGRVDVYIHIFLTSALAGGQLHTQAALPPAKFSRVHIGYEDMRRSRRRGEEKILDLTGTRIPTPRSSSPLSVAVPTTLSLLLLSRGVEETQEITQRCPGQIRI